MVKVKLVGPTDGGMRMGGGETKGVDASSEGGQQPGVPALVGLIEEGVDGVAEDEGEEGVGEVLGGHLIVLSRLALHVGLSVGEPQHRKPPTAVQLATTIVIITPSPMGQRRGEKREERSVP